VRGRMCARNHEGVELECRVEEGGGEVCCCVCLSQAKGGENRVKEWRCWTRERDRDAGVAIVWWARKRSGPRMGKRKADRMS